LSRTPTRTRKTDENLTGIMSDSECATTIQRFKAKMANVLGLFEGEVNSFLIQMKPEDTNQKIIAPVFNLTIRASIKKITSEAFGAKELSKEVTDVGNTILSSSYPLLVKLTWLKALSLYGEAFKNMSKMKIHSPKEKYVTVSQELLKMINGLENLGEKLSESVATFSIGSEIGDVTSLDELEKSCAIASKLTDAMTSE
jgi:hypothetical protein